MTEFEKIAHLALQLMNKDKEVDAKIYMEKADDCLRDNPNQITEISDFSIVGNLYACMVLYGWKSNRIANLAYWGLSKSLINSQKNIDLITTRLLVMIFAREQLKQTVGRVFGSNRSPYNPFDLLDQQFNDDEILDKIEISEILTNGGNFPEANIINKWGMLSDKYRNELSNPPACIKNAKNNQEKIFNYLNDKILIKLDLEFE